MSKAQLVITAVVLEGRSKSEVARDYDVSRYWVQRLFKRYADRGRGGVRTALAPTPPQPPGGRCRARREDCAAAQNPGQAGYDAGAATIAAHLARDRSAPKVPAVSTIWRILTRRGFVAAPAAETAPLGLETLPSRPAQPAVAGRCHPLAPRRSNRSGNPQPHRRPLPRRDRQPRPTHHHRPRRRRHLRGGLHPLGHTSIGAHR